MEKYQSEAEVVEEEDQDRSGRREKEQGREEEQCKSGRGEEEQGRSGRGIIVETSENRFAD